MSGVTQDVRARLWGTSTSYLDFLFAEINHSDSPSQEVEYDELGLPTVITPPENPEKKQWIASGQLLSADDWLELDSTSTYTMFEFLRRHVRDLRTVLHLYYESYAQLGETVVNTLSYVELQASGVPEWMLGNLAWGPSERPVWWALDYYVFDEGRVLDYDEDPAHVHSLAITGVDDGANTFTVAGDMRHLFVKDNELTTLFDVAGSTGNDGEYAVASVALVGGDTVVSCANNVPDATVDGDIAVANLQTRGARP